MRLSKNFYLHEFLRSQTAARNGIDMTPTKEVVGNLKKLAEEILQPLRDHLQAPVVITSGYRPPVLNRLIGGSSTSAHMEGRAADFVVVGFSPLEVCDSIRKLDLLFDQNIHEFGEWTHVGIAEFPRKQLLTAYRVQGRTSYVLGLHSIESLTKGTV